MPLLDQQGCVFNDGKFAEFFANARARWSRKRDELADVDDCSRAGHVYFPAIGMWMPFSRAVCCARS